MCTSIIPNPKMVDIHMHLIPGVDDGAEDMMMARMMLLRAREQGIDTVFCTPHSEAFHYSKDGARIIFDRLKANVASAYPDMKLYLGCEVYCEARMMEQVLENLNTGRYPTMNDTKYVLMEFYGGVEEDNALACVEAMVNSGYHPIIAHMERYLYLSHNMDLVDRFRDLGALIQINAYSLFDEDKDSVKNWARRLVLERKADFLGTDAHKTYHRPPSVQWGLNWLYENVNREYADDIAWRNAERLLIGCEEERNCRQ